MKLNLAICSPLDSTTNASTAVHFQIRTVKGHVLPFPHLMKCQAIDLTFSAALICGPLWPFCHPTRPHHPLCMWCFRAFGGPSTTWKTSAWCRWRSSELRDWWRPMSQVGWRVNCPSSKEPRQYFMLCLFVYATWSSENNVYVSVACRNCCYNLILHNRAHEKSHSPNLRFTQKFHTVSRHQQVSGRISLLLVCATRPFDCSHRLRCDTLRELVVR